MSICLIAGQCQEQRESGVWVWVLCVSFDAFLGPIFCSTILALALRTRADSPLPDSTGYWAWFPLGTLETV